MFVSFLSSIFLDGFASFRETFPEWCEDDSITATESAKGHGNNHSESLMGLRYLNDFHFLNSFI